MPKIEPKQIQKECDSGNFFPVYWIYGPERMKVTELLKKIRTSLQKEAGADVAGFSAESMLDAADCDSEQVVEAAKSPSFGVSVPIVVVRDAHLLLNAGKNPELLRELFGKSAKLKDLQWVVLLVSKELDGRKKFSKSLLEHAAVVECAAVLEKEREPWIRYLSQRRKLNLSAEWVNLLLGLDPWTLEGVDQELEKLDLSGALLMDGPEAVRLDRGFDSLGGSEQFLEAFFARRKLPALELMERFVHSPEESLPLLGLISWNLKHLLMYCADRDRGLRPSALNPYLGEKLKRWSAHWKLDELIHLQSQLADLDYSQKQGGGGSIGSWASLVYQVCRRV